MRLSVSFPVVLLLMIAAAALADVPRTISYQGVLKNSDGSPVADGTYEIVFRIYDAAADGDLKWQETDTLAVHTGVFNATLGKKAQLDLAFDQTYWLGVEVDGGGELSPLVELTSSPYAFRAAVAESTLASGAVPPHDHDDRYYTKSELDTPGTINDTSNPVDWTRLKNVPEDFADGVDNVGSGGELNLPYSGSTSTSGSAFSVTNTGSGYGVNGVAEGESGRGVYGQATNAGDVRNYGAYFISYGMRGRGVYGRAASTAGDANYGGFFYASGDSGRGVFGQSSGSAGYGVKGWASDSAVVRNYGGHFTAAGERGIGVYGWAENTGAGRNYGGYFVAEGDSGQGLRAEASGPRGVGVAGLASNSGDVLNFGGFFVSQGERGAGVYGQGTGSSSYGVWGFGSGGSGSKGVCGTAIAEGIGVYGTSGGNSPGAGVYGTASMASGRGVVGTSSGDDGCGVYAEATGDSAKAVYGRATYGGTARNYGGCFTAAGVQGCGVYGEASHAGGYENYGGYFVGAGANGGAVYAEATGSIGSAVVGHALGQNGTGVVGMALDEGDVTNYGGWFDARGRTGVGIRVRGGQEGKAAIFLGNVQIASYTGEPLVDLGEGLDYAEGFDVSEQAAVGPGSVLVIDPEAPGNLTTSDTPYDTRVAGIVAGAKGQGSGVQLGTGRFDHNVALAGRVYCNVDATEAGVEPGDLLTTSFKRGYAMKATDYGLAQGAILGKAMEKLAKGEQGQILVLVTLQ